jgi:ketosteroid isomerase-like protein
MSQENVELVRRCVSSWIRRDLDPEEFWAKDIEWHAAPEEPDARLLRGRKNVYDTVTDWFEQFELSEIKFDEFLDRGNSVLVCARIRLEGTEAWPPAIHLYTVAEGKVRSVRAFLRRDQALEAARLSE